MGFDDLISPEELTRRRQKWEQDKYSNANGQWIDENGVVHIGTTQQRLRSMNVQPVGRGAAGNVFTGGSQPPPPPPGGASGSVSTTGTEPQKSLWQRMSGRLSKGSSGAELRTQNTRPVRNTRREGVMDMEVTPDIFEAGMVGVTNGPQLSDGRGNAQAPHAPAETFLSSGDLGARTAHLTSHTQALTPQESTFQVQSQQHSQKGDQAYHAFAFEQPFGHNQGYGTAFTPGPYKTYEGQQTEQSYAPTHIGHDVFGTPYPEGEMSQFSEQVVQKHTQADTEAPFQNRKKATFYATQQPEEPPRYSSPQRMPVFEPLNEQEKKIKKDRMDLATFASKRKELDNALADVESRVKKVQGEGESISTPVLTALEKDIAELEKQAAATWASVPMDDTLEQLAEAASVRKRRNKEELKKIMNPKRRAQREEDLLYEEQMIEYEKVQEVLALEHLKKLQELELTAKQQVLEVELSFLAEEENALHNELDLQVQEYENENEAQQQQLMLIPQEKKKQGTKYVLVGEPQNMENPLPRTIEEQRKAIRDRREKRQRDRRVLRASSLSGT